jgi:hypothetical protein
MVEPRTAKDLAEELAPIFETVANLRYLIEQGQIGFREREAAAFDTLLQRVVQELS